MWCFTSGLNKLWIPDDVRIPLHSLHRNLRLKRPTSGYWWFSGIYFHIPDITNLICIQQLRAVILPSIQNISVICKQISLSPLSKKSHAKEAFDGVLTFLAEPGEWRENGYEYIPGSELRVHSIFRKYLVICEMWGSHPRDCEDYHHVSSRLMIMITVMSVLERMTASFVI